MTTRPQRKHRPVLTVIPAFLVACTPQTQSEAPAPIQAAAFPGAPVMAGHVYGTGQAGEQRSFQFEAREGRRGTGHVISTDLRSGRDWVASVSCAMRDPGTGIAYLGGEIVEGSPAGEYVLLGVHDGGAPGAGKDRVFSRVTASRKALERFCEAPALAKLSDKWQVFGGDLAVRVAE